MLSQENENFIRFLLLVLQGGTKILRIILESCLVKEGKTIDSFLTSFLVEDKLRRSPHVNDSMLEMLYPVAPNVRDVSKWDVSLLSFIILECLKKHLNAREEMVLKQIRDYRNELSHKSEPVIDNKPYLSLWTNLVLVISTYSHGTPYEDNLNALIRSLSDVKLDVGVALGEVNSLLQTTSLEFGRIQGAIDQLTKLHAETNIKLEDFQQLHARIADQNDEILQELRKLGQQIEDQQHKLKIVAEVKANKETTKEVAEKCVFEVSKNILEQKNSEDHLLPLRAYVTELFDYIEKDGNKLTGESTPKRLVEYNVSCNGTKGVKHILDLFDNGAAWNSLNKLGTTLSDVVGEPVRLELSVDLQDIKDFITETKVSTNEMTDVDPLQNQVQADDDDISDNGSHFGAKQEEKEQEEKEHEEMLTDDDDISDNGSHFGAKQEEKEQEEKEHEEMLTEEEIKRHSRGDAVQSQLNEMARTINAHLVSNPDFRNIIESDNLLAPMWQRFHLDDINWEYVLSNGPVWITRTKLLIELTDEDGKNLNRWKEIAKQITLEKGEICFDEPLRKEQEKIEIADWDYCVEHDCQIGLVHMMKKKKEKFLPNGLQLARACKRFGRKSAIIRIITQIICNSIKTSDKDIVWPAYEKENENDIIFVKIGGEQTAVDSKYTIKYWNKDCVNSENKEVISEEVESKTMIDCDEMKQIKKVINDNSKMLRVNHSNITMITASPFRSKGYKSHSHKLTLEKENCIVLLVPIKGIIPLQEEVFDESIGNIKTDVREGFFKWYVGGKPSDEHAELKIGCAIGPAKKNVLGTLGGFVDHPEYGLCGLTCAHVLLDEEEIRSQTHIERRCVQPHSTNAVFGTLKAKVFRDSDTTDAGLDIALIKIENRLPVDGCFPDMEKDDKRKAGFGENDEIRFTTGKICYDLFTYRDRRIVKYGAKTFLRRGVFAFDGAEFAICPTRYSGKPELVLKNQVQINDISNCGRFSDEGDSGSLVFIVSDNNELLAAGLLLGGCDGLSVMTPIRDVLLGIGCLEPLSMKIFPDYNIYHIEQMEM